MMIINDRKEFVDKIDEKKGILIISRQTHKRLRVCAMH